jgi:hypothetical protein
MTTSSRTSLRPRANTLSAAPNAAPPGSPTVTRARPARAAVTTAATSSRARLSSSDRW